jgi:hypothetical protein
MTFLSSPRVQSLRVDFRYHSDNLSINTKTARPVAFYIHTHSTHNMDAQFLVGHLAIYLYTWTRKKRKEIRRCRTDALAFIFSISSLWASPLARWSNLTACLTSGAHSSVPRWVKNQRNERCCCFQMKNNTSRVLSLTTHIVLLRAVPRQCVPRHLSRHANSMQISTRRAFAYAREWKYACPGLIFSRRDTHNMKEDALTASNLINATQRLLWWN